MTHDPAVSVIIPAYNQGRFLKQAVDSVLAQTFKDFEIIVVNDGSTDETPQVLAQYGSAIRVITQANAGLSGARNRALAEVRGRMIAFLDSDDMWYPEMLSATVACLDAHPEVDLAYGVCEFITEAGDRIQIHTIPPDHKAAIEADLLRTLLLNNPFAVHAMLTRKKCFDCCGLFDPETLPLEDWNLWLRLAAHGHRVKMLNTLVARYRRHAGGLMRGTERLEKAYHNLLAKAFSDDRVVARAADLWALAHIYQWLWLAERYRAGGQAGESRRCGQIAQHLFPLSPPSPGARASCVALASASPDAGQAFTQDTAWDSLISERDRFRADLAGCRAESDRYREGLERILNKPPVRAYRALRQFLNGLLKRKSTGG